MTTPTIEELWKRKSVRAYTDRKITKEEKELILRSASEAASAGNQQMYTILDITDQKLKDTLTVTCDNQPFIAKAGLVLVFCIDFQKWYDTFRITGCDPRKPEAGDFLLAVLDAAIAAQNAVTAAESLGIGSCYIGDILERYEGAVPPAGLRRSRPDGCLRLPNRTADRAEKAGPGAFKLPGS